MPRPISIYKSVVQQNTEKTREKINSLLGETLIVSNKAHECFADCIIILTTKRTNEIAVVGQSETNIQSIKEYCELVNQNLGNLSFSEKRKALESLRIKVIAGKDGLKLEGIIPIVSGQYA